MARATRTYPIKAQIPRSNYYRRGCLGEIVAVTKNLETLRWMWYYDSGVMDNFTTQTVDLDQIAAALSHVQGTLTDLTITLTASLDIMINVSLD
ncbi:hypothetical protein PHISCL_07587 [Aspergillus sclerotialis]|uniref:Uncharacterized protein n=1 Tax=Aspergillus sclerotialis TaxID=2070753 RepID=A0A3A2ZAA0_9EURO|nr:hypothetical protein PHISCL_07587 [Aspergillus sclerotialis]